MSNKMKTIGQGMLLVLLLVCAAGCTPSIDSCLSKCNASYRYCIGTFDGDPETCRPTVDRCMDVCRDVYLKCTPTTEFKIEHEIKRSNSNLSYAEEKE